MFMPFYSTGELKGPSPLTPPRYSFAPYLLSQAAGVVGKGFSGDLGVFFRRETQGEIHPRLSQKNNKAMHQRSNSLYIVKRTVPLTMSIETDFPAMAFGRRRELGQALLFDVRRVTTVVFVQ
jgi:hypothetical protein